jgi:hypothetical protein
MMPMLTFVSSAPFIGLVIALVALETLVVFWIFRERAGVERAGIAASNAAGVCLLLTTLTVMIDTGPGPVVLALAGALAAHAVDLALRLRLIGPTKDAA